MSEENLDRDEAGLFQPGHGVRGGRPKGKSEGEVIREYLSPRKQAVLDKLSDLAAEGDGRSLELFLAYLSPRARAESEIVSIPGVEDCPDIPSKVQATLSAVMAGQISPEQGRALLTMLASASQILDPGTGTNRLSALEQLIVMDEFPTADDYRVVTDTEADEEETVEIPPAPASAAVERPTTFAEVMLSGGGR